MNEEKIIIDNGQFDNVDMLCGYCYMVRGKEILCKGGEHEFSHFSKREQIEIIIKYFYFWKIRYPILKYFWKTKRFVLRVLTTQEE